MSIIERNLAAAKKHKPRLYEAMKKAADSGRYEVYPSLHKDGIPNMRHVPTGKLFYNNNDPQHSARAYLDTKEIRVPNFCVFLGFGLGYELMAVLEKMPLESRAVVSEPDVDALLAAFRIIDYSKVIADPRVHLYAGVPEENLYVLLREMIMNAGAAQFYVKAMNVIDLPLSVQLHKDYHLTFLKKVREAVNTMLHIYGNDPYDSLIGIKNTLLNINEILEYPGINQLKDVFKGRPGVVVATGPSLDKNVDLLDGLGDKAVIAAADASLKVMLDKGYKPHFVTSLERVIATSKLFTGMTKEDLEDVWFSPCPVVDPKTYELYPGEEKLVVYRKFATFEWLGIERGIMDTGPSAGNMAFNVLRYMGCDPIILIGQDLAYGPGDQTHAKGNVYGEKQDYSHLTMNFLDVPANDGGTVRTNSIWYSFLKQYEHDVANTEAAVINATEGGALIPGTTVMPFAEAIDKHIGETFNPVDIVRSTVKRSPAEQIDSERQHVVKLTEDALEYIKDLHDKLNEGFQKSAEMAVSIRRRRAKNEEIDVVELNDQMMELHKVFAMMNSRDFYLIMMHYVQAYYISNVVHLNYIMNSVADPVERADQASQNIAKLTGVLLELTKRMHELMVVCRHILIHGSLDEQGVEENQG